MGEYFIALEAAASAAPENDSACLYL